MKDDVKKNHRRIIAKALYSEILEYLDAHSGETFSKEELMETFSVLLQMKD